MKKLNFYSMIIIMVGFLLVDGYSFSAFAQEPETITNQELLGKLIFFDSDLSVNGTQSCATCHAPEVGWTGPDSQVTWEVLFIKEHYQKILVIVNRLLPVT